MGLNDLIKATKQQLLVTPIQEQWLMRNSNVELNHEIAQWVAQELQAKQRDRTFTWSASSLGDCQRKHIYQYFGAPLERGISADLAAIFQHGTWSHLKWQSMGYMAGWMGQTEVPCALPEDRLTGTIDGVLHPSVAKAGWELKTINARGYRFVMTDGPQHKHLRQITSYMMATDLPQWSLIYEEKNTQDYKEFVVDFDPALALQVQLELDALNSAVKTQTLPPMLPGCIAKTSAQYRQCPHREKCEAGLWPTNKLNLRIKKSSSPMS